MSLHQLRKAIILEVGFKVLGRKDETKEEFFEYQGSLLGLIECLTPFPTFEEQPKDEPSLGNIGDGRA